MRARARVEVRVAWFAPRFACGLGLGLGLGLASLALSEFDGQVRAKADDERIENVPAATEKVLVPTRGEARADRRAVWEGGWRGVGGGGGWQSGLVRSSFGGAAHHTEPYQLMMSSIRKITLKMAVPVVQILGFFLCCGGAWREGGWVGECKWPGGCVLTEGLGRFGGSGAGLQGRRLAQR